jgi:hypothetical protein
MDFILQYYSYIFFILLHDGLQSLGHIKLICICEQSFTVKSVSQNGYCASQKTWIIYFCLYVTQKFYYTYSPVSHNGPPYKGKQTHSHKLFKDPLFWQVFKQPELVVGGAVPIVVIIPPTPPLILHLK